MAKEYYATRADDGTGHGLVLNQRGDGFGRFADQDEAETVAACHNVGAPLPGWVREIDADGVPLDEKIDGDPTGRENHGDDFETNRTE